MPVVLITGCSTGGLGASLADEFARRGCRVYATARNVEKMKTLRSDVERLELDVLSDASVEHAVKTVIEREGAIDIVINNAGAGCTGPLVDLPLNTIQSAFETNVFSVMRVTHTVVPHMAKRKSGLVINMGSIAALTPTPWGGTYSATKAALHSLTDTLDMELRPLGLRVLLIAPGMIRSNIATNQTAAWAGLSENTLYAAFQPSIKARLSVSQGAHSTPSDVFSRAVVDAALAPTPPRYLSLGTSSWTAYLATWVPRSLRLDQAWSMYGKITASA